MVITRGKRSATLLRNVRLCTWHGVGLILPPERCALESQGFARDAQAASLEFLSAGETTLVMMNRSEGIHVIRALCRKLGLPDPTGAEPHGHLQLYRIPGQRDLARYDAGKRQLIDPPFGPLPEGAERFTE